MALRRRRFLELSAAAGGAALAGIPEETLAAAEASPFKPEKGARLQVLRWTEFVKGDRTAWEENSKKFEQLYGVPVQLQWLNWPDVSPKAALASQINSGPDMIMGWNSDPFLFPDKLVDVTDLVTYLQKRNGYVYPVARQYSFDGKDRRWLGVPIGVPGNAMAYRKDWADAAGFHSFPADTDGMLQLSRALKKAGHPTGFTFGHAIGDGNGWTHWLLWAFGGKMVNPDNSPAINSAETQASIDYARALYETMIDGVAAWGDANNNQAFLAGQISLTMNGISIWYVAKNQYPQIFPHTANALPPIGPVKQRTQFSTYTQMYIWKYSKYPNAAKEYTRFMLEHAQADKWVTDMIGYVTPAYEGFKKLPIWTSDPNVTPYRDVMDGARFDGWPGTPGRGAAQAVNEFVLTDMYADVCVNKMSPKAAMQKAENRLAQIYKG
ncbi:MAG: ABC transporter substrate-binding protein [Vulcanimicrobiaceae bacterium]